eukprot:GAHX01000656.1.p1 GENE.GAHX01000656.1~~GAHX01000656.1.p1  ORF type:complete len:127 (-),score=24.80 GAHX01000656.1:29-409(-)
MIEVDANQATNEHIPRIARLICLDEKLSISQSYIQHIETQMAGLKAATSELDNLETDLEMGEEVADKVSIKILEILVECTLKEARCFIEKKFSILSESMGTEQQKIQNYNKEMLELQSNLPIVKRD